MKVSWKLLNYLIKLENIPFKKFENTLILNGFEIEHIQKNNQDYILEISITSNRIELWNIARLTQEISIIFNTKSNIQIIKDNKDIKLSKKVKEKNLYSGPQYIKINHIKNIKKFQSNAWFIKYIINSENYIYSDNIFNNIKQYIKIKWGQDIYFIYLHQSNIDMSAIELIHDNNQIDIKYHNHLLGILKYDPLSFETKNRDNDSSLLLICPSYNIKYNNIDYFFSAYEETIQLLSTYARSQIGQSYISKFYNQINNKNLYLQKKYILTILGPILNKKFYYLNTKDLFQIFRQLEFNPKYENKIFTLTIPKHRQHDLKRNIDIVEEVARIYGFKKFIDTIPTAKNKGKFSKKTLFSKKVRNILRNLGLHEVINSPLCNLTYNKNTVLNDCNSISIYNPMTEEQTKLRNNLIENLINNYQDNKKKHDKSIEIFEIGKIFYYQKFKLIEELTLAGLIHNNYFNRSSWENHAKNISWFQVKGIIDNIFEKIQIKYYYKIEKKNMITKNNLHSFFNPKKRLYIYSHANNQIIGILGQLNKNLMMNLQINNDIYAFELNINEIIHSINVPKNINYILKYYSSYPCVTRDVSITLNETNTLKNITQNILNQYKELIESIQIINLYKNKLNKSQSLCLRIIYRAKNKTLNSQDIKNIDNHIYNIINLNL